MFSPVDLGESTRLHARLASIPAKDMVAATFLESRPLSQSDLTGTSHSLATSSETNSSFPSSFPPSISSSLSSSLTPLENEMSLNSSLRSNTSLSPRIQLNERFMIELELARAQRRLEATQQHIRELSVALQLERNDREYLQQRHTARIRDLEDEMNHQQLDLFRLKEERDQSLQALQQLKDVYDTLLRDQESSKMFSSEYLEHASEIRQIAREFASLLGLITTRIATCCHPTKDRNSILSIVETELHAAYRPSHQMSSKELSELSETSPNMLRFSTSPSRSFSSPGLQNIRSHLLADISQIRDFTLDVRDALRSIYRSENLETDIDVDALPIEELRQYCMKYLSEIPSLRNDLRDLRVLYDSAQTKLQKTLEEDLLHRQQLHQEREHRADAERKRDNLDTALQHALEESSRFMKQEGQLRKELENVESLLDEARKKYSSSKSEISIRVSECNTLLIRIQELEKEVEENRDLYLASKKDLDAFIHQKGIDTANRREIEDKEKRFLETQSKYESLKERYVEKSNRFNDLVKKCNKYKDRLKESSRIAKCMMSVMSRTQLEQIANEVGAFQFESMSVISEADSFDQGRVLLSPSPPISLNSASPRLSHSPPLLSPAHHRQSRSQVSSSTSFSPSQSQPRKSPSPVKNGATSSLRPPLSPF